MTVVTYDQPIAPPSRLLMLAEGRALWEAAASVSLWPLLRLAPKGDGHAVLVLPGLEAGDDSTGLLRRYLQYRRYAPKGWGQGRNLGPRAGVAPATRGTGDPWFLMAPSLREGNTCFPHGQ